MLKSSEETEDNPLEGERDLRRIKLSKKDVLVGISAGGQAPVRAGWDALCSPDRRQDGRSDCQPCGPDEAARRRFHCARGGT